MAQGAGELEGDGAAPLESIRAEMRKTRDGLTRKLDLLKSRLLHPLGAPRTGESRTMPAKKTTKSSAPEKAARVSGVKSTPPKAFDAKRSTSPKADASPSRKKTTRKKVVASITSKATEILGEVLTGAAVGAVTGAAQRVNEQPTAVLENGSGRNAPAVAKGPGGRTAATKKQAAAKKSGEVLGEMLSGAAEGAVAGAAKAVIPAKASKPKSSAKKK